MPGKMRAGLIFLVAMGFASLLTACGDDEVSNSGWTVEEGDGSKSDYGSDAVVVVTPGDPDSSVIVTGNPDKCVDIGAACVDLERARDEHGGRYCDEKGALVDVVIVDGEVVDMICYPPTDGSTDIRDTDIDVPKNESGVVITFHPETDGEALVGDIDIEGQRATILGNGPDRTIIDGSLEVESNNSRVRGVTVTGDVEYEDNSNNSALSFCRVHGDLEVKSNDFKALNCQVFGDVEVSGNNAILTNIGVQGDWDVSDKTECHGCYSFADTNEDYLVQPAEIGDELHCD